jgi:hypothetical protein
MGVVEIAAQEAVKIFYRWECHLSHVGGNLPADSGGSRPRIRDDVRRVTVMLLHP